MRKRLLLTATILLALTISACAGTRTHVQLDDISPRLSRLNNTPYDVLREQTVHYSVVGIPKYDRFFREAAILHATAVFALSTVERLEAILAGDTAPTLMDVHILVTLMTDTLPQTAQRAHYLHHQGTQLRQEAKRDFPWRFYKARTIRRAINDARYNLEAARDISPELLARLRTLSRTVNLPNIIRQSL